MSTLERVIKNLEKASNAVQEYDSKETRIIKISAFETKEEAELMRFYTDSEYNSLTQEEKQAHEDRKEAVESINKKYLMLDVLNNLKMDLDGKN